MTVQFGDTESGGVIDTDMLHIILFNSNQLLLQNDLEPLNLQTVDDTHTHTQVTHTRTQTHLGSGLAV